MLKKDEQQAVIKSANELMQSAIIEYKGQPVGTMAAVDPELPAENYEECFVRDFIPVGIAFLLDGQYEIVRNFLKTVLILRAEHGAIKGHKHVPIFLPASFKVVKKKNGNEELVPDFGDRAIGRVTPVDSLMWWVGLLARYVEVTGDMDFAHETLCQFGLQAILEHTLRDTFEFYPTLHTPDGCFMIDRPMGVHGHPLELQALFYAMLKFMPILLEHNKENEPRLVLAKEREEILRTFVREYYWLDLKRLNEIHRFKTEEFGHQITNVLNIYPESIPDWIIDWLPDEGGYLAGNFGPGRMDFRFFAGGNLFSVIMGLTTKEMAKKIFNLYEIHWDDLIGRMPAKICYPAVEGPEWQILTGSDPKNVPWSYHNGGNWPCILFPFVGAALRVGRKDLAEKAFQIACERLPKDGWPEYYDGKYGRLIGRRASYNQVWSASSLIVAHRLLEDPGRISKFYSGDEY